MTELAYWADGYRIPRERFYALACDPARSIVVEACAGAGKTWMLVSRILRALLDGAAPHEILAITFTRKAAGEMRERLNEWLREFGSPHTSDAARVEALVQRGVPAAQAPLLALQLATLHERVLREGRSVQVSTFHAWFAQLLRAAPLELLNELGLQQDMELIEDLDDHLDDLTDAIDPLLTHPLSESASKLPLVDKAKLHVLHVYALESLLFCWYTAAPSLNSLVNQVHYSIPPTKRHHNEGPPDNARAHTCKTVYGQDQGCGRERSKAEGGGGTSR